MPLALEYRDKGVVFIRINLCEQEIETVVCHEIGHLLKGSVLTKLSPTQLHLINKARMNRFMLKNYLSSYDTTPEYIDVYRFLDLYHLAKSLYDMAMAVQVFQEVLGIQFNY
ncbi:MAG: hypothetical protein LBI13_00155 [Streptococcaceae bacterium]|jgi:Zn-dependent protease with chaperone function|nr:hypothetical protein [Streptococcaceae bacterium]